MVNSTTPHSDPDAIATPNLGSSEPIPDVDSRLRQLAEEVRVRGREIDELQAMDKHRPWYRQASSIVAIGALVVSMLSAVTSYQLQISAETRAQTAETRAQTREKVQDRSDLRSILQRLIILPLEIEELYAEYPNAAVELSRNVVSERALLTGQAVKIIENLDQADDDLSASEYFVLAEALRLLPGGLQEARTYFQRAADEASNLNDEIGAVRSIAIVESQMGSYKAMHDQFKRALEVPEEYPVTDYVRAATDTETYLLWATHEFSYRRCVDAQRILNSGFELATEKGVFTADAFANARYQQLLASVSAVCP